MSTYETMMTVIGRRIVRKLIHTMLHIDVNQSGDLPNGAKIFAPNHPTTLDPLVIGTLFREPVHVLVTESAFKVPFVRDYLRAEGHIPVVEGKGQDAYVEARQLLQQGKNVVIFPEGELSPMHEGGLQIGKLHTGAVRLALETGAPIIPVGIALNQFAVHFVNTGVLDPYGQVEVARLIAQGLYVISIDTPQYLYGEVSDHSLVRSLSARLEQHLIALHRASEQRMRKLMLARVASTEVATALV